MEAILVATLSAAGAAVVSLFQARRVKDEAAWLRQEWAVEPRVWLPNLRRDAAHTKPTSAVSSSRVGMRLLRKAAAMAGQNHQARDGWEDSPEPGTWEAFEAGTERELTASPEQTVPPAQQLTSPAAAKSTRAKVPVESLRYAPCLLDPSASVAWSLAVGIFLVAGLLGPQISPGFTQFNALLIPLVTLTLAITYPLPWAWTVIAVGIIQGANCLGYAAASSTFQLSDANFCATMYMANGLAVALLAANAMERQRNWIVMKPTES